jgi:8-oxo-dGTP diphosphatase
MTIEFYDPEDINEDEILFVTLLTFYEGKMVLVKHQKRTTWEFPGGHIEAGETCLMAAKRELYEETGAIRFDLSPLCIFNVKKTPDQSENSYAKLYFVHIVQFDKLPDFEIEKIQTFESLPENLTYKEIQETLFLKYRSISEIKNY